MGYLPRVPALGAFPTTMKGPWSIMDPLAASQSDASSSDSEDDASPQKQHLPTTIAASPNQHTDVGQKKPSLDFEAISRHGYSGGPSVLYVPAPRSTEAGEQDWSWSTGSRKVENSEQDEENIEQRDQTRQIVNDSAVQEHGILFDFRQLRLSWYRS